MIGETTTVKQYYSIGGVSVGVATDGEMSYFLTDHLGSIVAVTDAAGTLTSETRYLPFGEVRTDVGTIRQTNYGYTNQEVVPDLGLMDYNARFYDSYLNRWVQPDTIIPNPYSSQGWNRYSYVNNNPIVFIDPSGHTCIVKNRENGSCTPNSGFSSGSALISKGNSGENTTRDVPDVDEDIVPDRKPGEIPELKNNVDNCFSTGICENDKDSWRYDLDPSHADYITNSVTVVSVTVALTKDRYGNKYFGIGIGAGKAGFGLVAVSSMQGYYRKGDIDPFATIDYLPIPSKSELSTFLTGDSVNINFGVIMGLGVNINKSTGELAGEYGAVVIGAYGVTYMNTKIIK